MAAGGGCQYLPNCQRLKGPGYTHPAHCSLEVTRAARAGFLRKVGVDMEPDYQIYPEVRPIRW